MDATLLDTLRLSRKQRHITPELGRPSRHGIRLVELPLATVRVRDVGEGDQTVIVVPDPPNVIEHHGDLFARLSDKARVVCFEAPGFGFSVPKRGFDFSLEHQADTVIALLAALRVDRCALAFSCVSVYAALEVARRLPEKVTRLMLMQAPAFEQERAWAKRVDFKGLLQTPVLGQALTAAAPRFIARRWYQAACGDPLQAPLFEVDALDAFNRGAAFPLASGLQAVFGRPSPTFAPVKQKAMVLWGAADRTHRRTDKRSVLAYAPDAAYLEFADAGHFPDLEQPERFASLLLELLAS